MYLKLILVNVSSMYTLEICELCIERCWYAIVFCGQTTKNQSLMSYLHCRTLTPNLTATLNCTETVPIAQTPTVDLPIVTAPIFGTDIRTRIAIRVPV